MNPIVEIEKIESAHKQSAYAICYDQEGFYTAGGDKCVIQWKWDQLDKPKIVCQTASAIFSVAALPNDILCVGTNEGLLHIVQLATKQELKCLQIDAAIFCLFYHAASQQLFASTADGKFVVIDIQTWTCSHIINLSKEKIRSIDVSESKKWIALACSDTHVYILSLENFAILHQFKAHEWACNVVQFHPEKELLFTASKDAHIGVWDLKDFSAIKMIPAHNYAIYSLNFNANGSFFITSGRDKQIKLWSSENYDVIMRLNHKVVAHTHSVNAQAWISDQKRLVTVGDDRKVIIWKIDL